jgi:hypothetical protein
LPVINNAHRFLFFVAKRFGGKRKDGNKKGDIAQQYRPSKALAGVKS